MDSTHVSRNESPSPNLDEAFEHSIKNIGIPPCPAILMLVIDETKKDEPDYNHLAAIINADVALSAGLIKMANSAYFGPGQRVRSVREALTVMGFRASSRAIANIALRNIFPRTQVLERFWDSSARVARLSGWLAQQLNFPELTAEDAYTYGLFRDCGIPILLNYSPVYPDILFKANNELIQSFTTIEDASLQTNHAIIGSRLAQDWRLPAEIYLAIRRHHELDMLEFEDTRLPHILLSARLIAISQFSEHIVQRQLRMSFTQEWPKLGAACLQLLEINEERLKNLYDNAIPVAAASVE
jgi:HD-like signal output (HDOD) protein